MAHGHHDGFLSWEWDSVLLLSNPPPLASQSLEANGSTSTTLVGSASGLSADFPLHQGERTDRNGRSSSHVHTESRQSESPNQSSRAEHGRDPRLDCPNFLAGKVPCACTENDDDDSGISRKRSKPVPRCQVATCGTELTDLKGYHQRHRVCLNCAQKTRVILREQPHRYCQQCGKFHPICDFDEGKRSCRRKLEKHNNRRRRRAGEDGLPGPDDLDVEAQNDRGHVDGLKALDGSSDGELKQTLRGKSSVDTGEDYEANGEKLSSPSMGVPKSYSLPDGQRLDTGVQASNPISGTSLDEHASTSKPGSRFTDFLPSSHVNSGKQEHYTTNQRKPLAAKAQQESDHLLPALDFSLQSSFQPDGVEVQVRSNDEESLLALLMENSDKSTESPKSDGEHLICSPMELRESSTLADNLDQEIAYSSPVPTGRISFKLYDWNPGDFPRHLRQQIMEWLSNMPVDLEGYIRSGCTILTIFIAMPQLGWNKLNADWAGSVLKLIKAERSRARFWSSGSIIARLDDHVVHVKDGEVLCTETQGPSDTPVLYRVRPLCLESGCDDVVVIDGRNLSCPQSRLLISFDGKYIINDALSASSQEKRKSAVRQVYRTGNRVDSSLFASIPTLPPMKCGTAYIEVENASGTSNYIPLLIAEKEIVNEVRSLEVEMEEPTTCCTSSVGCKDSSFRLSQKTIRNLLFDLGWVLKHVSRKAPPPDFHQDVFDRRLGRLRMLLFVAIERNWCNVVERVLQLAKSAGSLEKVGLLDNGLSALQYAAVRRKMIMVKHLLGCAEVLCVGNRHPICRWNFGLAESEGLSDFHFGAESLRKNLLDKKGSFSRRPRDHSLAAYSSTVTNGLVLDADISPIIENRGGIPGKKVPGFSPDRSCASFLTIVRLERFGGHGEVGRGIMKMRLRHRQLFNRDGFSKVIVTPRTLLGVTRQNSSCRGRDFVCEKLFMYIARDGSRYSELLRSLSVIRLVCSGFCILVLQCPEQALLREPLRQDLWSIGIDTT